MLKKWQEHSFGSVNKREAIGEYQSAQLDKSDSIQKRKQLYNMYKKCARLLGNGFNAAYAVYLLLAQKVYLLGVCKVETDSNFYA